MKKILLLLSFLVIPLAYAETKLSIYGSLNYTNSETDDLEDVDGIEENGAFGYGTGLRALMGVTDQFYFRSGAGLSYKAFSYDVDTSSTEGKFKLSFLYLNIPLTAYWKASNQVGIFGGTAINAKLTDDCDASGDYDSCTVKNEKTLVFPLILGFDFTFTEKLGLEFSYEYGLTETAEDVRAHTVVTSLLYHFE